jgi:hypothetical protein
MSTPYAHLGITPLSAKDARALLQGIVEGARRHGREGVVAFDLDSTLLNNRPRQSQILREYGLEANLPELAESTPEHWTSGWDETRAMQNAGLPQTLALEHKTLFKTFWGHRFFTSEYCKVDIPIEGAASYVRALLETGASIIYLTGRHEGMREGTLHSFRTGEFPLPNEGTIKLIMKPSLEEHDDVFKDRSVKALKRMGTIVAAFDNEPTHINSYRDAFPEAQCVHLATDCSLRSVRVRDGIPSITDFSAYAP